MMATTAKTSLKKKKKKKGWIRHFRPKPLFQTEAKRETGIKMKMNFYTHGGKIIYLIKVLLLALFWSESFLNSKMAYWG